MVVAVGGVCGYVQDDKHPSSVCPDCVHTGPGQCSIVCSQINFEISLVPHSQAPPKFLSHNKKLGRTRE